MGFFAFLTNFTIFIPIKAAERRAALLLKHQTVLLEDENGSERVELEFGEEM